MENQTENVDESMDAGLESEEFVVNHFGMVSQTLFKKFDLSVCFLLSSSAQRIFTLCQMY